MQVKTTISVEVPDSTTLDEVEKVLADELRKAGQRLLVALCQDMETHVLTRAGPSLRSDHRRARHLYPLRLGPARTLAGPRTRDRAVCLPAGQCPGAAAAAARQPLGGRRRAGTGGAAAVSAGDELLDSLLDVPGGPPHRARLGAAVIRGWLASRSPRQPKSLLLRIIELLRMARLRTYSFESVVRRHISDIVWCVSSI